MISKPITIQTWEHNDDLQPVRIMQGDAMSRILKITLASRGAPVDLTNTTVTAHFLRPGGLQSFLPADVTDAGAGLVQVTLTSQIAAVPGRVDLIIRAVKAEPVEVLFSGTARIEVMPNGVDDGAIEADNEFTALTVALAQVQQFEGRIGALETGKLDAAEKGVPGGVATLDPQTGKLRQTDGLATLDPITGKLQQQDGLATTADIAALQQAIAGERIDVSTWWTNGWTTDTSLQVIRMGNVVCISGSIIAPSTTIDGSNNGILTIPANLRPRVNSMGFFYADQANGSLVAALALASGKLTIYGATLSKTKGYFTMTYII